MTCNYGRLFTIQKAMTNIQKLRGSGALSLLVMIVPYITARSPMRAFFHLKKRLAEASLPLLILILRGLWFRVPPGGLLPVIRATGIFTGT